MNYFQSLGTLPLIQAIGWALVHFVWQAALIALVLAAAFRALRHRSANTRYLVGCAGMLAMLASPLITMAFVWPGAAEAALPGLVAVEIPAGAWQRLAPFLPAFTFVWLAGVFVLQTRLILNWSHAQHLKNDGTRVAPPQWEETVRALSAQMGIVVAVRIVESTVARVPMLIGWLRPVILVPTTAFTGLTPAQLRSIIAHELTHVRRHDYIVNLVQAVFETLLFYHPAVWWLSDRIRVEREYCCDDVAVGICGDALCYAKALSTLDGIRSNERQPVLASTGGSLMDRIRRIAGVRSAPVRRLGGWIAPMVVAMSVTAAVSAMAVTATAREADDERSDFEPLDQVNVVGIVREFRSEQAELISFLAESGMDNRVLLAVLEELGADERVFQAVDRATEREAFVEAHMPEARQWVADELAAGRLSVDAAREHLDMARRELRSRVRAEQRSRKTDVERDDHAVQLDRHLAELHHHFAREVEAGRMKESEAKAELEKAQDEAHMDMWLRERADLSDAKADKLKKRMVEFHKKLEDDLASGRITEEEAHARMERGKAELQEMLAAEGSLPHPTERKRRSDTEHRLADMERKYVEIQRELEKAVASGEMNKEQAHERLRGVKAEMDQLAQQYVVHRARAEEVQALADALRAEGASEEAVKRQLAKTEDGQRVRVKRLPGADSEHRLAAIKRELTAAVEAGRLTEDEAKLKMADVQRELSQRHKKRAARYKLSSEDRKALASGLDRARAQLEKAMTEGTITEEQAAKRLARLAKLEKSLEERAHKRERRESDSPERDDKKRATHKEKATGR